MQSWENTDNSYFSMLNNPLKKIYFFTLKFEIRVFLKLCIVEEELGKRELFKALFPLFLFLIVLNLSMRNLQLRI